MLPETGELETGEVSVFIVGFAMDRIDYKPQKLKFLSGLGYAIYVAAFDLDADSDGEEDEAAALDQKLFMPRPLSQTFMGMDSDGALGMGVWGSQHMAELNLGGSGSGSGSGSGAKKETPKGTSTESFDSLQHAPTIEDSPVAGARGVQFPAVKDRSAHSPSQGSSCPNKSPIVEEALRSHPAPHLVVSDLLKETDKMADKIEKEYPQGTPIPMALSLPPTWDPVDEFSYPVAEIPISLLVPGA